MKKVLCCMLVFALMFGASLCAFAEGEGINLVIDGVTLELDQPPVVIDGRTMVPLRAIFEAIGVGVKWNPETNTITGEKGLIVSEFTLDSTRYYVNGIPLDTDVAPVALNGRTFVPARVIAESFGCEVGWNGNNNTVTIGSKELQEYFHEEAKYTYYGELKDGKPHGYGYQLYESGDKYIGYFKDGFRDGTGTYFWSEYSRYIGDHQKGFFQGKGIKYNSDGSYYVGDWYEDKKSGQGTYYYANGEVYRGEWSNDLKNGWGIYYYGNGDKYCGQWAENKKKGVGNYVAKSGLIYTGEFDDLKAKGKGIIEYINGDKYIGEFENSKRNGVGTMYYSDGWEKTGLWKDDVFVK